MNDRRTNNQCREQAQKWFDALRAELATKNAKNDVIERLQSWSGIEDLLADCPRLLPPLLSIAWQMRHQPRFSELFRVADDAVAEDTQTPLISCGKSFDEIVLSHLHGAMRVYCERHKQAWLAVEKSRRRPAWLAKVPYLAPLILLLRRLRDKDILRTYPQQDLYQALKPSLLNPSQFALIEALATLPTRTVAVLGRSCCGLIFESSIRNLAALETRKCKFVAGLARAFAQSAVTAAEENRGAERVLAVNAPLNSSDVDEIAGMALSHLTVDGLQLVKKTLLAREYAEDVVAKMGGVMGYELWKVFADSKSSQNVALCPPFLARALGERAAKVHSRTSEALNSLTDLRFVDLIIIPLIDAAGRDALSAWTAEVKCAPTWARIVSEINKVLAQSGEGALTSESIAAFCQSFVPTFAALVGQGEPAPAEPVPA